MNGLDTTDKHYGTGKGNGRRAAKLEGNEKTASVRSNPDGGFLLILADGHKGKGSDMYTIEVKGRKIFETWDEAIAAGEEWIG